MGMGLGMVLGMAMAWGWVGDGDGADDDHRDGGYNPHYCGANPTLVRHLLAFIRINMTLICTNPS